MFCLLLALLQPPPVSDPPPVRAGSWVKPKERKDDLAEYREALRVVAGGGRAVVVVGGEDALLTAADAKVYRCPALRDFDSGVYDCSPGPDGKPAWGRRRPAVQAQPQPLMNLLTAPFTAGGG